MRLIDADKLKECAIACNIHNGTLTDLCVPLYQIDNAPTVKLQMMIEDGHIVPIVRPKGEWIQLNDYDYRCSICGNTMMDKWDYCPSCGADMRKETDNDRMA